MRTDDIFREVMNENEELKAEIYNLTEYLNVLMKLLPRSSKEIMDEHYDGMPGYVPWRNSV